MTNRRRALLVFVLSIIGAAAWFLADLSEGGFGIGDLAGPIFILGSAGVPSMADYIKLVKEGKKAIRQ